MKVNVSALIDSAGYIQVAIPYFISQGLSGKDAVVMDAVIADLIDNLKKFPSKFEDALDFNNPELKKFFNRKREIEDELIQEGKL